MNVLKNTINSVKNAAEGFANGAKAADEALEGDYSDAGASLERMENNFFGDGSAGVGKSKNDQGKSMATMVTKKFGCRLPKSPINRGGGMRPNLPDNLGRFIRGGGGSGGGSGDMGKIRKQLNDIISQLEGLVSQIGGSDGASSAGEAGSATGGGGVSGGGRVGGSSSGDSGLADLGRIDDGEQSTFEAKMRQSPKAAANYLTSDDVSNMELMELSRQNPKKFAQAMQEMGPGQRLAVNKKMKSANRTMKMISQTINNNHQTNKSVIGNMRV